LYSVFKYWGRIASMLHTHIHPDDAESKERGNHLSCFPVWICFVFI
jgi:hypothetical protein